MRFIIYITFILSAIAVQSQNLLEIKFEQILSYPDGNVFSVHTSLLQNDTNSLYSEYWGGETTEKENEDGGLTINVGGSTLYMYKDFEKGTIYFSSILNMKSILTQDSLNVMEWTLQKETEEILGYTCQLAVTEFRGRTYYVFFTDKLGFTGGPWKFDGLPGMILKIKSSDGVFNIAAKSIEIKNEEKEIPNPYGNLTANIITFEEFKELYRKQYQKLNRTEVLEDGGTLTRSMPKCQIECFVD